MSVGLLGADFSDPKNERTIYLMAAGLALLGIALVVFTMRWWKANRIEHPALTPLQVIDDREWAAAGDFERRRMLDEARPSGAEPLAEAPIVVPEQIDLGALARGDEAVVFDDLRDVPVGEAAGEDARSAESEAVVDEPAPADGAVAVDEVADDVAADPPSDPSVDPSANSPVDPPVDPSADLPTDPPVDPSADLPVDSPADPPVDSPADPSADSPADSPADPPADEAAHPAVQPAMAEVTEAGPVDPLLQRLADLD